MFVIILEISRLLPSTFYINECADIFSSVEEDAGVITGKICPGRPDDVAVVIISFNGVMLMLLW